MDEAGQGLELAELAKKQRMNTDLRKSIFCVIMGAEDYMDAYEKLNKLSLSGSSSIALHCYITAISRTLVWSPPPQPRHHPSSLAASNGREMVRVLVDCCAQVRRVSVTSGAFPRTCRQRRV